MAPHRRAVAIFFVIVCVVTLLEGDVPHPWLFLIAAAVAMTAVVVVVERTWKRRG